MKVLILLFVALFSFPLLAEELAPEPAAHPTFRVGFSGGVGDFGGLGAFEFRAMLHDLMDAGHNNRHFGIGEIGHLRMSWQGDPSQFRFDEITLFRLGGFPPRDQADEEKEWSYFISVGGSTVRDASCARCLSGDIQGGWGASLMLGEDSPFLLFGLISADLSLAAGFSDVVRVGVGPHAGLRLFLHKKWVAMVEGFYRYRMGGYHHGHHARGELRWNLFKNLSIWSRTEKFPDGWESKLGVYYYF